jgi:hypothetical protein
VRFAIEVIAYQIHAKALNVRVTNAVKSLKALRNALPIGPLIPAVWVLVGTGVPAALAVPVALVGQLAPAGPVVPVAKQARAVSQAMQVSVLMAECRAMIQTARGALVTLRVARERPPTVSFFS